MARTIKRTTVFQGRVFRVDQERAALAGGRTIDVDVVRHRGAVVLVPQPTANEVILIRQYRHVIKRWIWELPAGTLELGERPERAARRECEEEIGLRPRVVEKLGAWYPSPGFCDELMNFYACRKLEKPNKPAQGDEDEQIEPRTFTLDQAWKLARSGQIIDMKTIVGLGLVSGVLPRPRGLKPPMARSKP